MPNPSTTVRAGPRPERALPASEEATVRGIVRALVCTPLQSNDNVRSVELAREGGEWSLYVFVKDTNRAAYEPIMKALLDMQAALHRDVPGVLVGQHVHSEEYAADEPSRLILLNR